MSKPIVLGELPQPPHLSNKQKKSKNTNHTTQSQENTKKVKEKKNHENILPELESDVVLYEDYFNIHTFKMHPTTKNFIINQAIKLREWSLTDEALRITDFIDQQGYAPKMFYEWCKKNSLLQDAYEFALRRIGSRREGGAMTRRFAESTVHRTLGYYDAIWKQETRELAKLKEDHAQNETKVVVIERFPSVEPVSPRVSGQSPEEVAGRIHAQTERTGATGFDRNWTERVGVEE